MIRLSEQVAFYDKLCYDLENYINRGKHYEKITLIAADGITAVSIHRSSPEYALSLAERYLSELNYEQAIIQFEKYLEIEPMDAEAWLKLAAAYEEAGDLDGAIETSRL